MIHYHEDVSNYLREKYFKNDYTSFGLESGYYTLSVNGKKYEIKIETFQQYQDLQDYVETEYLKKFPELFL